MRSRSTVENPNVVVLRKGRQFTIKTRRSVTHLGQTQPQDHHLGSLLHHPGAACGSWLSHPLCMLFVSDFSFFVDHPMKGTTDESAT
jgi:hypothetical protein